MNDAELLRRYAEEGSQEAFAELVRLRIGLVYSAAFRRSGGDAHRAQDVAQVVFTELARHAASLCRHRALIGWLYTTTRYSAAKIARSERRRRAREKEAFTMNEDLVSPTLEIPGERLRPLLDDAMDHLGNIDRRALLLRFFDGYSMAELGRNLGLSEPAAKMRVERALGKLRTLLAKRGLSSTAAAVGAALSQEAAASAVPAGLAASVSGSAMVAASGTASGIGLVAFMTASKLGALIGVASILAVGTGVYEWQKSVRAQAELEDAAHRYDAEQLQLRGLLRSAQTADRALADMQNEVKSAAASGDRAKLAAAKGNADWLQFAANFPEGRGYVAYWLRLMIDRKYRLPLKLIGFTPAQIDDSVNRILDLKMQAVVLGPGGIDLAPDPDANQLVAIMGGQAFQKFKSLPQMGGASVIVSDIVASTGFAGSPLSDDETELLTQIVVGDKGMHELSEDWPSVENQAQSLLSPAQWKAAEGIFLKWEYQTAIARARQSQMVNPAASAVEN